MNREELTARLVDYELAYERVHKLFLEDDVISSEEKQQLDLIQGMIATLREALAALPAPSEDVETPEWDPEEDLSVGDADALFEESYMDDLMKQTPPGSDSVDLNAAMEGLLKSPDGNNVEQYLEIIANETGASLAQVKGDYKKFLAISQQAKAKAASNTEDDIEAPEMIDESKHGDFLGSTASLRYGKVVGDHFGISPVFGAMLNPTGGIVGPGNTQLYDGEADDPLVKHGVVHDAAGYLKNYHDAGPGYDYLDREDRDTTDPFVGQESGIQYWLDKDGREDLKADAIRAATEVWGFGLDTADAVEDAYDGVTGALADAFDWAAEQGEDAERWANETLEEAERAVERAWEALVGGEEPSAEAIEAEINALIEQLERAPDQVQAALDVLKGQLETVMKASVDASGNAIELAQQTAEKLQAVLVKLSKVPGKVQQQLDAVEDVLRKLEEVAGRATGETQERAEEVVARVREQLQPMQSALYELGETLTGLADDSVDWVADQASDVVETLEDAAQPTFAIVDEAWDYTQEAVATSVDYWSSFWTG